MDIQASLIEHYRVIRARIHDAAKRPAPEPQRDILEIASKPDVEAFVFRPEAIIKEVAKKHRITIADIKGPWRKKELVAARMECVWRLRQETNFSFPRIARAIGRADHTSALHLYKKYKALNPAACEEAAPAPDSGEV
jgi:chromosomal replication initiation ATPase DnaA